MSEECQNNTPDTAGNRHPVNSKLFRCCNSIGRHAVDCPVVSGPLDVDALHLKISDGANRMHLMENGDLAVILARGQDKVGKPGGDGIPCGADDTRGHVVIVLDVDEDHDEVFYSAGVSRGGGSASDILPEAIYVLETCLRAAQKAKGMLA